MTKNLLATCILFAIPLNASQEEVAEVIDSIRHQFNITTDGGTVAPATLATNVNASLPANPAVTAATGELDAEGLPWSDRIHSSSKNKNADGTWRIKKGADKALVARVKAELLSTVNAQPVAATAPAITQPATVAATTPTLPAMPGLPPMPGAGVVQPDPFAEFVSFLTANTNSPANPAGRLTAEWIKSCLTQYGVPNGDLQNLAHNHALIPNIEAGIKQVLGIA